MVVAVDPCWERVEALAVRAVGLVVCAFRALAGVRFARSQPRRTSASKAASPASAKPASAATSGSCPPSPDGVYTIHIIRTVNLSHP